MKKYLLFLFVAVWAVSIHSEEITVGTFETNQFNSVWKRQFTKAAKLNIDFNDKYEKKYNEYLKDVKGNLFPSPDVLIYGEDTLAVTAHTIDGDNKEKLIGYIDKYIEWNKKASKENKKLEKDIGKYSAKQFAFKMGDDWYFDNQENEIAVTFFSQKASIHQLVFDFPKITSGSNQFMTNSPNQWYLSFKQVNSFRNLLTDKSIEKAIKKYYNKKKIEDEFK